MVAPSKGAQVFVDSDLPWHSPPGRVVGDYERKMPRLRDDGVSSVARALAVVARVDMNIGHYQLIRFATSLPHGPKLAAVELNDAVCETRRIHIVIEEEVFHPPNTTGSSAEQEGTTLSPTGRTSPEFVDPATPGGRVTDQPRRLAQGCAQERWK